MDTAAKSGLDRFGTAVDILELRPRQPADHGLLGAAGNFLDTVEIPLRGDGKARLDDIDAHLVENFGDFELLLEGHGGAGALFAVAQGRIEDHDAVAAGVPRCLAGVILIVLHFNSSSLGPSLTRLASRLNFR